jgi:transglutaminase-like putative cysteine protease
MKYKPVFILFLFFCNLISAQKIDYATLSIPENLKENANSVVVNQHIDIAISSQKHLTIKKSKAIRVLNELGLKNIDATEYYDKSTHLNSIEAVVYNSFGKEIKKIKRKDFKDQSVADGFSIYNDGRIVFLDYTPTEYPFTIVYNSEVESSNTVVISSWHPIDDVNESVIKSSLSINFPLDLGFNHKEFNFEGRNIVKKEGVNYISYTTENLPSIKNEEYSPSIDKFVPKVIFNIENFSFEGINGKAKNWDEYGKWYYDNLINGTEILSAETKLKILSLVEGEKDPIKKAEILYKYVQDRSRYVSVQVGIGGWKPMLAKDVDRLGYGDCKALSNYMRSLLDIVGIKSYITLISAGSNKKSIDTDFVFDDTNHMMLTIPYNEKKYFLECTSQVAPFGYQGNFTDDRFALLIKPEGGEIIKTNDTNDKANTQQTNGNYSIDENGNFSGTITIKSKGVPYDNKYDLEKKSSEKIADFYKSDFSSINNLKIESASFNNNREAIEFTENLKLNAVDYGSINANNIIFPVNAFNQNSNIPQRYRTRNNPFEIARGFFDQDEIEISIPDNYSIEAKPENFEFKDKFGEYKIEISIVNPHKIIYKRSLLIHKGFYEKEDYENYRKFREQIAKADNSKIMITKKQS